MASTAAAPRHLSYAEARALTLAAARPLPAVRLPLAAARGRALRERIVAPHDLPPFANSSMDGYALRALDSVRATTEHPVVLPVTEVIPAGRVASKAVAAGTAMRIMTGAGIPEGADAVVPFEDVERRESDGVERVVVSHPVASGDSIRSSGMDLRTGETALDAGRELSAHDVALLAALGIPEIQAGPRPRVAVISTGDELLDVTEPLRPGAIRDSNGPMLAMLVEEAGGEPVAARHARDNPDRVVRAIRSALEQADVVMTIGGVSAGDFDPVKTGLAALRDIELWRVAMKPGRPQAFGAPGGKLFFGLPGNPASVACVFEVLVRPALRALQGFGALDRPRLAVRTTARIVSRAGRTDFVRATLEMRADGAWVTPAGEQVSGHMTPQSRAHVLAVVPESAGELAQGDALEAILLRWPEETPHGA